MHPDSFEQVPVTTEIVGELDKWVIGRTFVRCCCGMKACLSRGTKLCRFRVQETDPGVKGDTATGGTKPAKLATGAIVKVPLFISEGEVVTIDTRTGEYQGRK